MEHRTYLLVIRSSAQVFEERAAPVTSTFGNKREMGKNVSRLDRFKGVFNFGIRHKSLL